MNIEDKERKLIERALKSHAEMCLRDIAKAIGQDHSIMTDFDCVMHAVSVSYEDAKDAIALASKFRGE